MIYECGLPGQQLNLLQIRHQVMKRPKQNSYISQLLTEQKEM